MVMELGGKSANIVFADADLDAAIPGAVHFGCCVLSGQGCMLPTRLIVESSIYDEVVDRATAVANALKVGLPWESDTVMGPLITTNHLERIEGFIERGIRDGAKLLAGGERLGGDLAGGNFISPAVFGDVDIRSELAQEEVFGPVLSVLRFEDKADAEAKANDSRYGLAGYLWTRNGGRAHRVAREVVTGSMCINAYALVSPHTVRRHEVQRVRP